MANGENEGRTVKNLDRTILSRLEDLPNIGTAIAGRLRAIGIDHPQQLPGKDPLQLYKKLCQLSTTKQAPCVLDTFMSAVHFMEGGKALPWWTFTAQRKRLLEEKNIQDKP